MANNNKIYIPTYISSVNYDPARILPRLMFYNGTIATDTYYIQNSSGSGVAQNAFPYFDNYSGNLPTTSSLSLLFNNELSAYGDTPTQNLYTQYWETYVNLLYNPVTRLIECSAIIPLADYFKLGLNDIVEWRGNYYHLRAINDYNLKNGECNLQLLGPIIGDTIANILPGQACLFDFTIEDYTPPAECSASVSWSLVSNPSASQAALQISVNGTTQVYSSGSHTGNFALAQTSSLDIFGGSDTGVHSGSYYSMSVIQNSSSIYEYFGNLYGEYHFTSSCSSSLNVFVSSSYVLPSTNVYKLTSCSGSATTYVTFFDDIIPSGSFVTSRFQGCWYVNSAAPLSSSIYDNIIVTHGFTDCTECQNPTTPCRIQRNDTTDIVVADYYDCQLAQWVYADTIRINETRCIANGTLTITYGGPLTPTILCTP